MHSASEIEELFQKLQKEVKDLLSAQKSICVISQRSGSFSILQKTSKIKTHSVLALYNRSGGRKLYKYYPV